MKVIPLSKLKGACREQLAIVKAEWPNGIPVTQASARRAVELKLDLGWAAAKLLDEPANLAHVKATAAAYSRYTKAKGDTWVAYAQGKQSSIAYEKVEAAAWKRYSRVSATALLELLRKQ